MDRSRICFGADVGNKRKGAGVLDASTLAEIQTYLAGRELGPLFLGPKGGRLTKKRLLAIWREAFGLGVLDYLWPKDEEPDSNVLQLVNQALLSGNIQVSKGGKPRIVKGETLRLRSKLERRVWRLTKLLRDDWELRMEGSTSTPSAKPTAPGPRLRGCPPC